MKYLSLLLLSCLPLFSSGQQVLISYEQNVLRGIWSYEGRESIKVYQFLTEFNPAIYATWHGLSGGILYDNPSNLVHWSGGYTLTVTPNFCLRTQGSGLKIGFTIGQSFIPYRTYRDEDIYRDHFSYQVGYQHGKWYGAVFRRFIGSRSNYFDLDYYGLQIGYSIF